MSLFASIALMGILVLCGCESAPKTSASAGPANIPARDEQARSAGLSDPEITAAKQIYLNKCARCHKFYDPAGYETDEWNSWMKKMSRKARLKTDQAELLTKYLEVFRRP